MERTIRYKPSMISCEPEKTIRLILDTGCVYEGETIEIKDYFLDEDNGVYTSKMADDWVKAKITAIQFGYTYDSKTSYEILGEEIPNPNYEKEFERYNQDVLRYETELVTWEKEEAQYQEELKLAKAKEEFDIYIKLKAIYDSKPTANQT